MPYMFDNPQPASEATPNPVHPGEEVHHGAGASVDSPSFAAPLLPNNGDTEAQHGHSTTVAGRAVSATASSSSTAAATATIDDSSSSIDLHGHGASAQSTPASAADDDGDNPRPVGAGDINIALLRMLVETRAEAPFARFATAHPELPSTRGDSSALFGRRTPSGMSSSVWACDGSCVSGRSSSRASVGSAATGDNQSEHGRNVRRRSFSH
ncbi:hypothetical protein SPI_00502 [Niveomyces insectorum RCEF 264]|uniref:Uncharacterized protein n=1 Tax=Niveomyces insectorum RCEF 264 TaxID=1081102 RepID=A0A168A6E0_9HYPO|nr:hypothetical protein SPI_00502 [Niveomyces insectorum RCEF 264]